MAIEVRFNQAALRSLGIAALDDQLRITGQRVLNAARRETPVDTGALRASLTLTFTRGPGGMPAAQIGSNLPYAIMVHEGTGIYGPKGQPIRPRRAQRLVFTPRGASRPVFARSVRGSKGTPFLLRALQSVR